MSTIILCHLTLSGEIACYPKQSKFQGNLLTVDDTTKYTKLPGRTKLKLKVYDAFIELLSLPGQWVFDPTGGTGKLVIIQSTEHFTVEL